MHGGGVVNHMYALLSVVIVSYPVLSVHPAPSPGGGYGPPRMVCRHRKRRPHALEN